MGDLPKWKNGLIVMGDPPKKKKKNIENWSHCKGWPTQKKVDNGSKAHLKGGRVRKKKHYLRSEGSKARSKGGRVRKHTTWMVVAQRHTWNEVGLENALLEKWWWNTDLTHVESNALWLICMYVFVTYLRNIGPPFVVNFFELLFQPFLMNRNIPYPLSEEISGSLWGPFLLHWVLRFIIISKGKLKRFGFVHENWNFQCNWQFS
jgi:hypothetical protein